MKIPRPFSGRRAPRVAAGVLGFALWNLAAAPQDYSKEAVVLERFSTDLAFSADGTAQREERAVVRLQSEAGVRQFGVVTFRYEAANQRVDLIEVRVRKPDGSVVETPQTSVQDVSSEVAKAAPTYSDLREKQVPVKGLAVGDVLEYRMRLVGTRAEVPGQFWFEQEFVKGVVVLEETLRISVPADKYVQVKSPTVKPEVREEGGRKIYLWKTARLEPTSPESPKKKAAQTPEPPSVRLTTFRNWEEVGRWYRELVRPQTVVTPAIQAKAEELTKGLATDAEKQRAIYRYVSAKIRYIRISFGLAHYQPHPAEEVLSNQYGDCKDKHTLLAALLKAAGIEAWPALIVAGGKLDTEVPSPSQLNHLITVLPQPKGVVWLDTTPEVAPYAYLSLPLRDQQALVIPDKGPAVLMTTDADPPFPATEKLEVKATLDANGTLTGHFDMTVRGDPEVLLRGAFHQTQPSEWLALAQRLSYGQGYAGTVSNLDLDNVEDSDKPFHYSYDYERKDYPDWANHRISPPIPFALAPPGDEKPVEPLFLGAPGEMVLRATVRLPEGYSGQAPPGANMQTGFAEYTSTYSVANGVLAAEKRLLRKKSKVPLSDWAEYVKLTEAVATDEAQLTQLSNGAGVESNADALQLVQKGFAALQSQRYTEAEEDFDRAGRLNPKQVSLWAGYAVLSLLRQQPEKAIGAFKREIANHPEQTGVYRTLAKLQDQYGHSEDTPDTWRGLMKADPKDTDAAMNFWIVLQKQGRYSETVEPLRATLKAVPDDPVIEAALGEALLRAGKKDEGLAVLTKFGEHAPSAIRLNNAAWALADTGADLVLARQYAEKAVLTIEDESKKVALSNLADSDLGRMTTLDSVWDTLGWVYFRVGDLAKAERYVRAGWMLGQIPALADHLGQIYERQGNKEAAIRFYQRALAVNLGMDEVRARLEKLTPVRIGKGSVDELGKLRTTAVPGLLKKTGSAEFFLLFSPGKIEDAQFISGTEGLRNARDTLLKTHFDVPFPDGSSAKIVRRGILACSAYTSPDCQFTFIPAADTKK